MGNDAGAVQETLRSLVTGWRYAGSDQFALIEALASAALAAVVEREGRALLDEAARSATEKRWRPDDVVRVARRQRRLGEAEALVSAAVNERPRFDLPEEQRERVRAIARLVTAVVFLLDLPVLPELATPAPVVDDPEQVRMLEKVRALLAKAESTSFEEEAEAFTAKAQELMARYAIDEALVDAGRGAVDGGAIAGGMRIGIDEPYASPKAMLLGRIATENRCRAVWSEGFGMSTVFGSQSDLRAVEVLYTSLLVQAVGAMQRAGSHVDAGGRSRTRSFRHAFLLAFAQRIGERLREANRAAEAEAVAEVGNGFLPVLASRAEAAERARAAAFPQTTKMRTSISNAAGYHAGRAAADAASIERGTPLKRTS